MTVRDIETQPAPTDVPCRDRDQNLPQKKVCVELIGHS